MNKTKIIATIGPSSSEKETIKKIIEKGVDVIRVNMSHSNFDFAKDIIFKVREVDRDLESTTGIMIDTRGPEIRIGDLETKEISLEVGKTIRIVSNTVVGNSNVVSTTLPELPTYCKIGERILVNDGNVELVVVSKTEDELVCNVNNDGIIKSNCSINIPEADFNIKFLSEFDKQTIAFAVSVGADYLALSHVNDRLDVLDVNDLLIELGDDHIQMISKIENQNAIEEIEDILSASDGVMIARGDLGIEVELEKIPSIQKMIANKAKEAEKICVIATEMLSTMQEKPRPTRAEVSDVANAVLDGTDAVMLSSETAIGKYPVETVETMDKIIGSIEKEINYNELLLKYNRKNENDISSAVAYSTVDTANRVNAKAIVCSTMGGNTAKRISHFRSDAPVIAISPNEKTIRGLSINYGIIPIRVPMVETTDEMIKISVETAKNILNLENEDKIVIAGTFPINSVNYTNFMKVEEVKGEINE